jgi:tetratricopeptide (TPR) repeat protein
MSSGRSILACALLIAVVFVAFAPALDAVFVNWDDSELLLENPHFRGLGRENVAWCFTTNHAGPYQPLTWLSYAFDHALWGITDRLDAPEARGFHLSNIVLHALTACGVFALARRLLGGVAVAWIAAGFFALHPLRVESVAWVTERRDVLYGALLVASLLAWLEWRASIEGKVARRGAVFATVGASTAGAVSLLVSTEGPAGEWLRFSFAPWGVGASLLLFVAAFVSLARAFTGARSGFLMIAALCFVLSLLAKASGMTFALALLVIEWGILRREVRRTWIDKVPFAALGVVAGALAYMGQAAQPQAVASWESHTLGERWTQACYGLVWYLRKSLWPSELQPIYELPSDVAWSEPRFAGSILIVLAAILILFALRRRVPPVVAAFVLYALSVAPMLGLAQCGPQLVADRYSYVPTIPLAILAAHALFRCFPLRGALACGVAACVGLALLTREQCGVWRDSHSLWSWSISVEPRSAIAQTAFAEHAKERAFASWDAVERRRLLSDSLAHYAVALELETAPRTACNAAVVELELAGSGDADASSRRLRALELGRAALSVALRDGTSPSQPHLVSGLALFHLGRFGESVRELQLHLDLEPQSVVGWSHLGVALLELGRARDAQVALSRAVELRPMERSANWYLALACERSGDLERAVAHYEAVLRLAPGHADAASALARLRGR